MPTVVRFYKDKVGGEVFAYFPNVFHSFNGYRPDNRTCYSHIGQHSACHPDYVKNCQPAKPEEYDSLLKELIDQGYTDLEIIKSTSNEQV